MSNSQSKLSLTELLENKRQSYSGTANIYVLDYFDENILDKIENEYKTDHNLNSYYKDVYKGLSQSNPSAEQYSTLFKVYAEAEVYIYLKDKLTFIEKIPEQSSSTPDFKCRIETDNNGEKYSKEFFFGAKDFRCDRWSTSHTIYS